MPRNYFKLDLYFFEHPKAVDLSHAATVLFLASIAYANRRETDGFIARPVVRKLVDIEDAYDQDPPTHDELAACLVKANLWEPVEGGWQIHDFADHNDTSDERAAKRADDAARKRKQRHRESTSGQVTPGQDVTPADVTPSHNGRVTASHAIEVEVEVEVTEAEKRNINTVVEQARPVGVHPAAVQQVFDAWQHSTGKHKARLDDKRRRKIQQALKTYPLEDILDAVQGWRNSPHHCGQNDRGTVYNDLELLLRDAQHIEAFRDLARDGPGVPIGKRTQQLLNHQQGMHAVGMAKGVIGNGNGLAPMGAPGRPDQRELARPADRTADSR